MADVDCSVEYREIPGFPYYRVGSDGSIWSCNYGNIGRTTKQWRRIGKTINFYGYHMATLYVNTRAYKLLVHRLVAMTFFGPIPSGYDVCHNDNNRTNNRIDNLRYDTRKGNLNDRIKHGTMNWGTRQGHVRLNEDKVRSIRSEYANGGVSYSSLGRLHDVDHSTIYAIIKRKSWKHIA